MSTTVVTQKIVCVCKLRSLPKQPAEQMVIRNIEALRLAMQGILLEEQKDAAAPAYMMDAKKVLDDELKQYLSGVKHTVPFITSGYGMGDIGSIQW
jgi:hypothetical protein